MKKSIAFAMLIFLSCFCGPSMSRSGETALVQKSDEVPARPSMQFILSQNIDLSNEFKGIAMPFKTAIKYLTDVLQSRGIDFQLSIDPVSSGENARVYVGELLDQDVIFPTFVGSCTIREYLDNAVGQLSGGKCFVVRGGMVVVMSADANKIDRLLDRKIAVDLRKKSVVAALEEVSALSGVSIVVDPRCNDGQKNEVMLRTNNDMSVRGILESIAEIHDLKLVADAHRVTMLPRAVYLKRLRDQAEEAAALRELKK